ncbi:MAG TPA: hypothetical protein VFV61_09920 [Pyrinomonadaceae bacterium]|nr:hypothetical protein [Pyrinomonadaceae bacterium]
MIWIVRALLAILFIVGVMRLILFFRSGAPPFIEPGQPVGKQRLLMLGFLNILISGFSFFLLQTNSAEPWEILFGGPLIVLVFEVTFRKDSILPFQ